MHERESPMRTDSLEFSGERVVPWASGMRGWSWVLQHHLARYTWALKFCVGQNVTDLGCGTGYGSFILSWLAENIRGLDVSQEAIEFARNHFTAPNLDYVVSNLDEANGFLPESSVYTCFECLEHLTSPLSLLQRIADISPNSLVVGSVPLGDPNRFHKHVYNSIEDVFVDFGWPSADRLYFIQDNEGQIYPWPSEPEWAKYVLFLAKASAL